MSFVTRRKPIVHTHREGEHRLKATLGWPHLVALGVGAIIGTGIYTLTGVAAGLAGPAVILSFALAGVVCACAATGANAVIADGVPTGLSLTPDQLRNIEVGFKGSLLDGRVRVAASVYDIEFTDLQSAFNTSIGLAAFANLGDATTRGLDIETSWDTPIEGLTLDANLAYLDARYEEFTGSPGAACPRGVACNTGALPAPVRIPSHTPALIRVCVSAALATLRPPAPGRAGAKAARACRRPGIRRQRPGARPPPPGRRTGAAMTADPAHSPARGRRHRVRSRNVTWFICGPSKIRSIHIFSTRFSFSRV